MVPKQCEHVASSSLSCEHVNQILCCLVCLHGRLGTLCMLFIFSYHALKQKKHVYNCLRCFTFFFASNCLRCFSSAMKVAPSILQKPTTKSDSLYFYKGKVLRLGSQGDAEVAQAVYYHRLCSAKTMLRRQINDAASQRLCVA